MGLGLFVASQGNSSCPQSHLQPHCTIGGWQKVRKMLVPAQGRIKTPYVLGLNRCSCRVTPFVVPSLPPCICSASITGTDSPYSQDVSCGSEDHRHSPLPWLEILGKRLCTGLDRTARGVKNSSPAVILHRSTVIPFLRDFCYAIILTLSEQKRKEALKFPVTLAELPFHNFLPCDE